jgi:hypothetical protein
MREMLSSAEKEAMARADSSSDELDDLSEPLLWTFFFFGERVEQLELLGRALLAQGYERAFLRSDEGPMLSVCSIERHSVNTLMAREEALGALAEAHGVDFDGHDVGPSEETEVIWPDGDPLV